MFDAIPADTRYPGCQPRGRLHGGFVNLGSTPSMPIDPASATKRVLPLPGARRAGGPHAPSCGRSLMLAFARRKPWGRWAAPYHRHAVMAVFAERIEPHDYVADPRARLQRERREWWAPPTSSATWSRIVYGARVSVTSARHHRPRHAPRHAHRRLQRVLRRRLRSRPAAGGGRLAVVSLPHHHPVRDGGAGPGPAQRDPRAERHRGRQQLSGDPRRHARRSQTSTGGGAANGCGTPASSAPNHAQRGGDHHHPRPTGRGEIILRSRPLVLGSECAAETVWGEMLSGSRKYLFARRGWRVAGLPSRSPSSAPTCSAPHYATSSILDCAAGSKRLDAVLAKE